MVAPLLAQCDTVTEKCWISNNWHSNYDKSV